MNWRVTRSRAASKLRTTKGISIRSRHCRILSLWWLRRSRYKPQLIPQELYHEGWKASLEFILRGLLGVYFQAWWWGAMRGINFGKTTQWHSRQDALGGRQWSEGLHFQANFTVCQWKKDRSTKKVNQWFQEKLPCLSLFLLLFGSVSLQAQ